MAAACVQRHLDCERALDLVLRGDGLDHCKSGI